MRILLQQLSKLGSGNPLASLAGLGGLGGLGGLAGLAGGGLNAASTSLNVVYFCTIILFLVAF